MTTMADKYNRIVRSRWTPMLAFIVFSGALMLAIPAAGTRFFSDARAPYDANIYIDLAARGYSPALTEAGAEGYPAFYPLWPLVLHAVWYWTDTMGSVVVANLLATFFFLVSLLLLHDLLRRNFASTAAVIGVTWLYTLNPNSVFHAIPYAESMFCVIFLVFLRLLDRSTSADHDRFTLMKLLIVSALLSATRPIMLQLSAAMIGAMALELVRGDRQNWRQMLQVVTTTICGVLLGYGFYGFYCTSLFNDFWYPFRLQALWGRELGMHWQLIFSPRAVSGSVHVLIWDLLAFYLPIVGGILLLRPSDSKRDWRQEFLLWFCLFFWASHSAIAFLSQSIFMSLGRHVWAGPAAFVVIAALVQRFKPKPLTIVIAIIFSLGFFCNWWARYGRDAWMG